MKALTLAISAALLTIQTSQDPAMPPVLATSTVGIEGRVLVRVDRGSIVARAVERGSPVVLRIADIAQDGASTIYDLRFIGQVPGTFDLRESLEHGDGTPAADMAPVVVEVGSLLPAGHGGDLFGIPGPGMPRLGGYRALLVVAGAIWVAPVGWVVARRLRRRPPPVLAPIGRPHTLGDQLRPLVEAAIAGRLSTGQSAELEMLLLAHWRRHRRLDGLSPTAAIAALRQDPEAGPLLAAMDRWLHCPSGSLGQPDIGELLSRYRDVEAIELSSAPLPPLPPGATA
ncbi:MAG: hypothetical protein IPJ41_11210 [Phycisphaerales bacterium]|nr:hypothetical protein [Phycisphaerales bacterium]